MNSYWKNISSNQRNSNLFDKPLLSRNFCQKSARVILILRNFHITDSQCGNCRISLSHFLCKNFLKVMVLLKKLLKSCFDEFFSVRENFSFFHTLCNCTLTVWKLRKFAQWLKFRESKVLWRKLISRIIFWAGRSKLFIIWILWTLWSFDDFLDCNFQIYDRFGTCKRLSKMLRK